MASERPDIEHAAALGGAGRREGGTSPVDPGGEVPRRRKAGLGRRLDEVIETHGAHARPAHLVASSGPMQSTEGAMVVNVAVVETADAVRVDVEAVTGAVASARVTGSLEDAVVRATVDLLAVDTRWDLAVGGTRTRHGDVIVVTADDGRGTTRAGAACVEAGRPWAIARAIAAMVED